MRPEFAAIADPKPIAEHVTITPSVLYVGTPVALLTTMNADGTSNISPMSSVFALFDRIVLGLTATSKGRENAAAERELVVNFPGPELWPAVEALARTTGRDPVPGHKARIGYEFEPGKFARSGLTPLPSECVRPPRIAECPIQLEAEVMDVHDPAGDWPAERPEAYQIIEARVVRVHAHRNVVIPGTNHIDLERWSPLLYVFRHYFATGPDLGRTFKAEY